jgi:hypothetical protein
MTRLDPGSGRHRWLAALSFGLAFAFMVFTFIGTNLLKLGLHRY